jgi:epoxyqueuosine reductase
MAQTHSEVYTKLAAELSAQNIRFRLVPINRIEDLQEEIDYTLEQAVDSRAFANYTKSAYSFDAIKGFPEAKSLLVASVFNPAHKVIFQKQDRDIEVLIPPGYVNFRSKQMILQQKIADILTSFGYRTERIILPVKLLAVRSGLAEYGKNNISYVEGFGSFHFLGSFLTDLADNDDFWQEPKVMDACENCNLCQLNCPTGAVGADRFLLHGEKCITLYNRNPGEFPDWIKREWHHAIVGCIKCQSVCPQNANAYKEIPLLETFTVAETDTLLSATEFELLPEDLKARFTQFGFPELHRILLRNIKAVCM